MNITMATDMALKRQAYQAQLLNTLIESLTYSLVMGNHDERERIIIPFTHPSLFKREANNTHTGPYKGWNDTGFIVSRWK